MEKRLWFIGKFVPGFHYVKLSNGEFAIVKIPVLKENTNA